MRRLSLLLVLATGCTAINGYAQLEAADLALGRADEQNAKELAPYEYTLAQRYLEKASEEAGYSDWKASEIMAKEAAKWADQAIITIQQKAAVAAEPAPEGTAPPPPPATAPAGGPK